MTDFIVILYALYNIGYIFLSDASIPYNSLQQWIVLLLVYLTCRLFVTGKNLLCVLALLGFFESVLGFLQLTGLYESTTDLFKVTGSFYNPGPFAGFLTLSGLSSLFLWRNYDKKYISYFFLAIGIFIILIMLLSDSRASLVSLVIGLIFYIFISYKSKINVKKIALGIFFISFFLIVLYGNKRSSADGRLLIWRVSLDMIQESPIYGHGIGSFEKLYMLYQKGYFERNSDSVFKEVASNNRCAYNEFIHVAVEQGIMGLIILLILVMSATRLQSNTNPIELAVKSIIISWFAFACFSYPSEVFRLMVVLVSLLGVSELEKLRLSKVGYFSYAVLFLGMIMVSIYSHSIDMRKEKLLHSIVLGERGDIGKDSLKMLIDCNIDLLQKEQYLYDRAILSVCEKSTSVDSLKYLLGNITPSSQSYCAIGGLYCKEKKYDQAEQYFTDAHYMVPKLLTPIWQLFRVKKVEGDYIGAAHYAIMIKNYSVKIENTKTLKYRREALEYMQDKAKIL